MTLSGTTDIVIVCMLEGIPFSFDVAHLFSYSMNILEHSLSQTAFLNKKVHWNHYTLFFFFFSGDSQPYSGDICHAFYLQKF